MYEIKFSIIPPSPYLTIADVAECAWKLYLVPFYAK